MIEGDALIAAVEAIHAVGPDATRWPEAFRAVTQLCGGAGMTFGVFDKATRRHSEYRSFQTPDKPFHDYLKNWAPVSPRVAHRLRKKAGEVGWDYEIFDERAMDRDPFYAEMLPRFDFRYSLSGTLANDADELVVVAVERTPRQGHVDSKEVALMWRLIPHFQQAFDVSRRLKAADQARGSLEGTLDWLAEGVALVRPDGSVTYVNSAFAAMARRRDGIALGKNCFELADAQAQTRLAHAIGAVLRLRGGDIAPPASSEVLVSRGHGASPYVLSVRTLIEKERASEAVAIVFVRDPMARNSTSVNVLRELFGLTEAEATLAQALQAGVSLPDYARTRRLSLNTVYTHLRRVREKTNCTRLPQLIDKLNQLCVPLRAD